MPHVINALAAFAQPQLLETDDLDVDLQTLQGHANTEMLVAPISRSIGA